MVETTDPLLDALRRQGIPMPASMCELPSSRELDAALRAKYDAPPPPRPRQYRGGGR